ncbi:ParA family protein [Aeromicrobium yanjiei]|nr:ParA family protein [Aeromicrobium yanjiei]
MDIDYQQLSRVVSVATGKGGVLKTSIAANVAGVSARAGFRTLLVELDPQSDLGDDLGYFGDHDNGEQLTRAILTGDPLQPTKVGVRENLDVVTGGEYLSDTAAALAARAQRRGGVAHMLAKPLAPLAATYDLVIIDTPPVAETLQLLALGAARWLVIPTRFDASSIKAMRSIAARVEEARSPEHRLDILAVVLAGVSASATKVREGAETNIKSMLEGMDEDLLLPQMIRESAATARACRDRGMLAYEIAEEVEGAQPYWEALRSGQPIKRLPGSAPALSDDYIKLTDQLIRRLAAHEEQQEATA